MAGCRPQLLTHALQHVLAELVQKVSNHLQEKKVQEVSDHKQENKVQAASAGQGVGVEGSKIRCQGLAVKSCGRRLGHFQGFT